MKKIAILVNTGFEDIELITPIDIFKRAKINFDLFSTENKKIVHGSQNAIVVTKKIHELDISNYIGVFIPGGPAVSYMINNKIVLSIIKKFYDDNKYIFAICAAPSILNKIGILENTKHTAYPGFEFNKTFVNKNIVIDKKIITAKGPGVSHNLAFAIVELLKNKEVSKILAKSMQFTDL